MDDNVVCFSNPASAVPKVNFFNLVCIKNSLFLNSWRLKNFRVLTELLKFLCDRLNLGIVRAQISPRT